MNHASKAESMKIIHFRVHTDASSCTWKKSVFVRMKLCFQSHAMISSAVGTRWTRNLEKNLWEKWWVEYLWRLVYRKHTPTTAWERPIFRISETQVSQIPKFARSLVIRMKRVLIDMTSEEMIDRWPNCRTLCQNVQKLIRLMWMTLCLLNNFIKHHHLQHVKQTFKQTKVNKSITFSTTVYSMVAILRSSDWFVFLFSWSWKHSPVHVLSCL